VKEDHKLRTCRIIGGAHKEEELGAVVKLIMAGRQTASQSSRENRGSWSGRGGTLYASSGICEREEKVTEETSKSKKKKKEKRIS